ncbi:hypothetical protein M9Y10_012985 [Tritrichomonas musculus]|uniref:Uncharacterized protein n=1 Tax=Tritrichomonas musculus TaxID=1915356 RepID=A0ABR2I5U2_9EUKA
MEADDQEHEFWRICVRSFPLRSQILFFPFDADEVENIKEANEWLEADQKK